MTKRRSNHEGTLYKLTNGSFRAQIRLNGERLSHTAKTEKECIEWRKKTITQIDQGLTYAGAQTTLAELLDGWLVNIKSSYQPESWYIYKMNSQKRIIPSIGHIKLKDLIPEQIQRLYDAELQKGTGRRTIEVIHVILHKSLDYAVKKGLIGRNPTDLTNPPRPYKKEMKFYDENETYQFLLAARGDRNEVLYQLVLATGLRQSEVLGLKWSDLDIDNSNLTVQRQLKRNIKNGDYFKTTKTASGRRSIKIGKQTLEKLKEHRKNQALEKMEVESWEENDLIFPSRLGTPLNQSNLLKSYKSLIRKSGLKEIRFHDLRHTAASLMLNHGVPVIIVSKRLGHSKVSVTLDTYGHVMSELQDEAAELIDDLITPVKVEWPLNGTKEPVQPYITK
jgi:integrase